MMSETSKKDLAGYLKQTIGCFAFFVVLLAIGIWLVVHFDHNQFVDPLVGSLAGVTMATINLFAIGYAFYIIAIKKGRRWAAMVPVISFGLMSSGAYVLATACPTYILGFAVGLASPILFGALIAFLSVRPA